MKSILYFLSVAYGNEDDDVRVDINEESLKGSKGI